jgi:hypothetical protein
MESMALAGCRRRSLGNWNDPEGEAKVTTEIELADGLRKWAKGRREVAAAIELLIAHRIWLLRGTTRPAATGIGPLDGAKLFYWKSDDRETAVVEWAEARRLTLTNGVVCTPQDRQVLALAVSLAGESKFSPKDFLAGLDEANLTLANQAIADYDEAVTPYAHVATTPKPDESAQP